MAESREQTIRKVLEKKGIPWDYKAISSAAMDGLIATDLMEEAMLYFEDEINEDALGRVYKSGDPAIVTKVEKAMAREAKEPGEMYRALGFEPSGYPKTQSKLEKVMDLLREAYKSTPGVLDILLAPDPISDAKSREAAKDYRSPADIQKREDDRLKLEMEENMILERLQELLDTGEVIEGSKLPYIEEGGYAPHKGGG